MAKKKKAQLTDEEKAAKAKEEVRHFAPCVRHGMAWLAPAALGCLLRAARVAPSLARAAGRLRGA